MDAEEDLLEKCSADWQKAKAIQGELQKFQATPMVINQSVPHDVIILHEREKRLKAELEATLKRELTRIPQNKDMQVLLLEQESKKELDEYREALAFLRAKRSDQMNALKESEEEEKHLKQINDELKKRLAAQGEQGGQSPLNKVDIVIEQMEVKVQKVTEADRYFKGKLKELLTNRCPLPETTTIQHTLNESQDVDASHVIDTKHMVGRLVDQAINNPGNPYITLDQQTWPALVEFLLRCHIAEKHPDDPKRIKLVPFHM